ncbi:MAG: hypothetical protein Q9167_005200 [Letrouitia subvulpina]
MDGSSSSETQSLEALNLEYCSDDDMADSEVEPERFKSFFDEKEFSDLQKMLDYCNWSYGFDLTSIQVDMELDEIGLIKLVNYVRSESRRIDGVPDLSSRTFLEGDRYLKPTMADDAVLFSLPQLASGSATATQQETAGTESYSMLYKKTQHELRLFEKAKEDMLHMRAQMDDFLRNNQETVEQLCDKRCEDSQTFSEPPKKAIHPFLIGQSKEDDDADYFSSYNYSAIHETMLKDKVRTGAYRDFVYDNKDIFTAGAAKVIAVDNSGIIDKTREIVFENGLGKIVQCLRGKIEEVKLPVEKVDIIISEWMGYCLLYEAMLESVLWARDRYLSEDGLMVPSHASLYLSPLADPEFVDNLALFWQDIYGFKMTCMQRKAYEEVMIQTVPPQGVQCANKICILELPLHDTDRHGLGLMQKEFAFVMKEDMDKLDGFVIWFDIKFDRTRKPDPWRTDSPWGFTTAPGKSLLNTHWQQGVMLIDPEKNQSVKIQKGERANGHITVKAAASYRRALEIDITWNTKEISGTDTGSRFKGSQTWLLQ